jgi:hypothetical protein
MPARYTVSFLISMKSSILGRFPKADIIDCSTLKEAEIWKNMIDDTCTFFTIKDNASGKIIFNYEKDK